ncbi:MAG: hypothetical protein WCF19_07790 [Chlamydiales bacterium]
MLQTKALYNLLRLNAAEDPAIRADPWALEDLRAASIEALLSRAQQYKIKLDKHSFLQFSEACDHPEGLTDLLLPDDASETTRDPFYLLIFELWRRLLPEKQCLSVFCDELDHRIALYDRGEPNSDEQVQDSLAHLLEIFDENVDSGADPEEIFIGITDYCAHDVEGFLYDYISDLLHSGNSLYASELIEGFSQYVTDPVWFDFLRVRLLAFTDIGDANLAMHRMLENELDLPFLIEMLRFLSANGERDLFQLTAKRALPLLSEEEDLIEIIRLSADFYGRLGEEKKEKAMQALLVERQAEPDQFPIVDFVRRYF